MESILHDYDKQKNEFITILDELKQSKFIPCNLGNIKYEESHLDKLKESLINEDYIISICGQIKAGKSTFLNKLLFDGREILPCDDIPCTAKLAKISYGEKNIIKVIFYTSDEWNSLKELKIKEDSSNLEVNYFDKYLREYVDAAAEEGIYDKEVIHDVSFIKHIDTLENLKDYVSKDGLYTPFVSHVELEVKNDFIKNIIIVDTPGINDPNEHRSRITEQWISQSTAVLMLIYAGKPMEKSDYEFIDQHLAAVPSNRIIFALSKIDLIGGKHENVKRYVENTLKTDKHFKDRKLLDNKEVYPISVMAAIIKHKELNNIVLTADEEFYKKKIPLELIDRNGYLPELYSAIEKHIMSNKGAAFLNKTKVAIKNICESKIYEITHKIVLLEERKENTKLSTDQINAKKQDIKRVKDLIEDEVKRFADEKKKIITSITNDTLVEINKSKEKMATEYEKWLDSKDTSLDDAIKQTTIKLKVKFEENIPRILDEIITENNSGKIEDFIVEFKRKMKEITKEQLSSRMEYIFKPVFDFHELLEKVQEGVLNGLAPEKLNMLKRKVLGFLWAKKSETKNNIRNEVHKSIDSISNDLYVNLSDCVSNELDKIYRSISSNIKNSLNKLDEQLKEHETDSKNYEFVINDLKEQVEEKETTLSELKSQFELIKTKIGGVN